MAATMRWMRLTAALVMAVVGVLASVVALGHVLAEGVGVAAVTLVVLWVLGLAALSVAALRRPDPAGQVLVALAAGAVTLWLWFAVAALWWVDVMDAAGPILPAASVLVAVPAGLLGLRRPWPAGPVLLAVGAAPALALLALSVQSGLPARAFRVLEGATLAAGVPATLVAGGLLVAASLLERGARRRRTTGAA